jgi:hypothetical protein
VYCVSWPVLKTLIALLERQDGPYHHFMMSRKDIATTDVTRYPTRQKRESIGPDDQQYKTVAYQMLLLCLFDIFLIPSSSISLGMVRWSFLLFVVVPTGSIKNSAWGSNVRFHIAPHCVAVAMLLLMFDGCQTMKWRRDVMLLIRLQQQTFNINPNTAI